MPKKNESVMVTENNVEICMTRCKKFRSPAEPWTQIRPRQRQPHKTPVRITLYAGGGSGTNIVPLPPFMEKEPESIVWGDIRYSLENPDREEVERFTGLKLIKDGEIPEEDPDAWQFAAMMLEEKLDDEIARLKKQRCKEDCKNNVCGKKTQRCFKDTFGIRDKKAEMPLSPEEWNKKEKQKEQEKHEKKLRKYGITPEMLSELPDLVGKICDPTCKTRQESGKSTEERPTCMDSHWKTCNLGPGDTGFNERRREICISNAQGVCKSRREGQIRKFLAETEEFWNDDDELAVEESPAEALEDEVRPCRLAEPKPRKLKKQWAGRCEGGTCPKELQRRTEACPMARDDRRAR